MPERIHPEDLADAPPPTGGRLRVSAADIAAPVVDEPSLWQRAIPTALRVVGGVGGSIVGGVAGATAGGVGAVPGAAAGGALGSGLGEWAAEQYETATGQRSRVNPRQVLTQAAIGAIPVGKVPGAGAAADDLLRFAASVPLRRAGQGAALGAGSAVATQLAETGELPEARTVVDSAVLGGALGAVGGVVERGQLRTRAARVVPKVIRGQLRAAPWIAGERGPAAPAGTPMPTAPDPSFVRGVPAEYARREVRGSLPPVRGFVVDASGVTVPADQAATLPSTARPQPVRLADETVAAFQRRTGLNGVEARRAFDAAPIDVSGVSSVPAAVVDRAYQFTQSPEGRTSRRLVPTQYSGDVNAVDAPVVQLSAEEARELRRMAAELEAVPFTPHTFSETTRQGGTLEIVPGSAGAPVYQDIIGDVSRVDRAAVQRGIDSLLEGKMTPTGDLALDVARRRLAGDAGLSRPLLPVEAGDTYQTARELQAARAAGENPRLVTAAPDDEAFARFASELDGALDEGGVSAVPAGGREPGQEGFIAPQLAARVGLGTAGAAYGAATGDSPEDRLTRAVTFGAAGALAPSLVKRVPMEQGTAKRSTFGADPLPPIPPADPIPASRLSTMPNLTADVQDAADAILDKYAGFPVQRRGVQSVARTDALSDRVSVNPSEAVKPGTAMNAERLRAYQNATATILTKRKQLEAAVKAGTATPAQELELARARTESEVLMASYRGAAAEAGRALHILRYQARILQSGDQEAIREAVAASRQGLAADVQAYYYANILSGVATHERNVLGNVGNAVFNLAAQPFAAGADAVRSAATGQPRSVFLGELPERVAGTVAALPKAFSSMLQTLKTGIPPGEVTTFDRPVRAEFRGGGANPFNYPSRLLDGVDDFFSTVAAQQTLYGTAFGQAKREGYTGAELVRRVAELRANPSAAMLEEVNAERARLLFREDPGKLAAAVLAAKRHLPALGYVVPFVRVPANIIKQGFEASPAGFALKGARQGGRAGAEAMGRAALGSAVLAPLAFWAAAGKITGDAPADPAKRAAFYESGRRPNSIQIGETWYSYQPIQPLNVPLAVIANGFQTWRERGADATADQVAADVAARTASSLLDQSFLSGLSALVDALGDPERYGQRFAQQLATGFVPFSGALRTVAQATDPVVRAPQSVTEAVQAIVPGQSEALLPRLTRFGEPVQRGQDVLNVFRPSRAVTDPVAAELAGADVHIRPAQGPNAVTLAKGVSVPLAPFERVAMGQASGQAVRSILEALIASPGYQGATPPEKQALLERAITEARSQVNAAVRKALLHRLAGAPR